MCGLAGTVGAPSGTVDTLSEAISARGPDGYGTYADASVAMLHTRLAIQDLTAASDQPFRYGDGILAWNGELYNAGQLRDELRHNGHSVATSGDTEVVAAALDHWGLAGLSRLRGMFALAWWQPTRRRLLLARDRFGMKPLYFRNSGDTLLFASSARPLFTRAPSPELVATYLQAGSLTDPDALGVKEVPAGGWLQLDRGNLTCGTFGSVRDLPESHTHGSAQDLATAFADSVRAHLVGDVPVALLLSGGVDSTAIALQASRLDYELTCFTVDRGDHDWEPAVARSTAARYGHRQQTLSLDSHELSLYTAYTQALDLPSIDGFNVYAVSRSVHDAGFKVVLAGTGGDELLGGYRSYRMLAPARALASLPSSVVERLAPSAGLDTGKRDRLMTFHRAGSLASFHSSVRSVFSPSEVLAITGVRLPSPPGEPWPMKSVLSGAATKQLAVMELERYLRYTLLRDGDACAMANAVEMRFPFVDAEFAPTALAVLPRLPRAGKPHFVDALQNEWLARVSKRPKRGFDMPLNRLLRGPLRGQVDEIPTLADKGLVERSALDRYLRDWERGETQAVKVWALMVLAAWCGGLTRNTS